jgi:hypothetical protein
MRVRYRNTLEQMVDFAFSRKFVKFRYRNTLEQMVDFGNFGALASEKAQVNLLTPSQENS